MSELIKTETRAGIDRSKIGERDFVEFYERGFIRQRFGKLKPTKIKNMGVVASVTDSAIYLNYISAFEYKGEANRYKIPIKSDDLEDVKVVFRHPLNGGATD